MGMIQEPPLKVFQNNMFILIAFINAETPKFKLINAIVSIFRIFKLFIPALLSFLSIFWEYHSSAYATVGFLSIFYKILPNFGPILGVKILLCIFILTKTILFLSLYGASYYLRKTAKLPKFLSPAFGFYFATFGYLFPNIALAMCGFLISHESMNRYFNKFSIVIIAISLIYDN